MSTVPLEERIAVAFDIPDREACETLLSTLGDRLRLAKIGSALFSKYGPQILQPFFERGIRVFLDLKYHDIPNTVAKSIENALSAGPIDFLTIHASGGQEMIRRAREAADAASSKKTRVLAVTVLTSLDEDDLRRIGFSADDVASQVDVLARLAVDSGAHGVVCSAHEIHRVRSQLFRDSILMVPGIRSESDSRDDQQRTATASQAFSAGADYIVVGRPIYGASDPQSAFQTLLDRAAS